MKGYKISMWHRSLLFCISEARKRGVCLYGAGYWGDLAYKLFQMFNITPLCYCDDDSSKVGREYNHMPVLSVPEAAASFPAAVYIVCVDLFRKYSASRDVQKCMLDKLKSYHIYDSNSELRLPFYLFLLDIGGYEKLLFCKLQEVTVNADRAESFHWSSLKKIIIVSNMSNSGVWFFTQLMDMHSHILCLPFSESLEDVYRKRLQYLEGNELIIEMAAQMLGYFKSEYEDLNCVGQYRFKNFCIDRNGENLKDVYIEPIDFIRNLYWQFEGEDIKLHSYGHMLKIYFAIYNNCIKRKYEEDKEYWMLYDVHRPDYDVTKEYDNLSKKEFIRIENLFIVREPVQHCFSWVKRMIIGEVFTLAASKEYIAKIVLSELGKNVERKPNFDNFHIIKFEDIKYKGKQTLEALCEFLQIPFEQTMMQTTLNGIEVYFPANTKEGVKYITGFDHAAVSQKDYSEILSPWDEVRLNIFYSVFKKALGYREEYPSFCEFKKETLEDILKEDFKFASIIQNMVDEKLKKEEQYDVNQFVKKILLDYVKNYDKKTVTYYNYIGSGNR